MTEAQDSIRARLEDIREYLTKWGEQDDIDDFLLKRLDAAHAEIEAMEAVLLRLHRYFSDPRNERPEFKELIETVITPCP